MSNAYLQALISPLPRPSSLSAPTPRASFGMVPLVAAGLAGGTVALTAGAAEALNAFYKVEGTLPLDAVIEQVNEANSAFPAIPPAKDGPSWFSVSNRPSYSNARKAPTSVGDANAKALFWMALASRAMASKGLAGLTLEGIKRFDMNMYQNKNPSEIRNLLLTARSRILEYAGNQTDSIRGIPETLNAMAEIDAIKSSQGRSLSPIESVKDLFTQAPSNATQAAESLFEAGQEAGQKAICEGKKTFLPDFMLNEKCEIRTWVIPAGIATVTVLAGTLVWIAGRRQRDLVLAIAGRDRLEDRSPSQPTSR